MNTRALVSEPVTPETSVSFTPESLRNNTVGILLEIGFRLVDLRNKQAKYERQTRQMWLVPGPCFGKKKTLDPNTLSHNNRPKCVRIELVGLATFLEFSMIRKLDQTNPKLWVIYSWTTPLLFITPDVGSTDMINDESRRFSYLCSYYSYQQHEHDWFPYDLSAR